MIVKLFYFPKCLLTIRYQSLTGEPNVASGLADCDMINKFIVIKAFPQTLDQFQMVDVSLQCSQSRVRYYIAF